MALLEPNLDPTPRELRRFALYVWPAIFALLGALVLRWSGSLPAAAALWLGAAAVSAVGLRAPRFLRAVYLGWMRAVYPIGWTVSHLAVAIAFYGVMTPIGVAMRLAGRDPLRRRPAPAGGSYWLRCEAEDDVRYYFRQF